MRQDEFIIAAAMSADLPHETKVVVENQNAMAETINNEDAIARSQSCNACLAVVFRRWYEGALQTQTIHVKLPQFFASADDYVAVIHRRDCPGGLRKSANLLQEGAVWLEDLHSRVARDEDVVGEAVHMHSPAAAVAELAVACACRPEGRDFFVLCSFD